MESYDDRLFEKLAEPDLLSTICRHVANGGTMVSLAETWRLSFGDLSAWVNADPERLKRYQAALADRGERAKEVILHELRLMGEVRFGTVTNIDGSVKSPAEWPEAVRAAVKSVEYGALDPVTKLRPIVKVTFHDKKQAMELLGKNLALFIERHQVEGKFNLDEFLKQVEGLPRATAAHKEDV